MYDLTFKILKGTLIKITNQKNRAFFMPHVYNQNGHPFWSMETFQPS
jgi:hypothetical protein